MICTCMGFIEHFDSVVALQCRILPFSRISEPSCNHCIFFQLGQWHSWTGGLHCCLWCTETLLCSHNKSSASQTTSDYLTFYLTLWGHWQSLAYTLACMAHTTSEHIKRTSKLGNHLEFFFITCQLARVKWSQIAFIHFAMTVPAAGLNQTVASQWQTPETVQLGQST